MNRFSDDWNNVVPMIGSVLFHSIEERYSSHRKSTVPVSGINKYK
ncbi:hypothetical protein [Parabacteroides sp.]